MFKKIGLSLLAVAIALPLAGAPMFANAARAPRNATGNTPHSTGYDRHSDGVEAHRRSDGVTNTERNQRPFVHGFEDGNFHPDRALTRAEFSKMLHNLYGNRARDNDHNDGVNHTAHRRGIFGQEGRNADGRGIIGQEGRHDGTRHYDGVGNYHGARGARHYDGARNFGINTYRHHDGHTDLTRDGARTNVRRNARNDNNIVRNAADGVENVYRGTGRVVRNTVDGVENATKNTVGRIDNAYRTMHNNGNNIYRHNYRNNPGNTFNRTGATLYNPGVTPLQVDAATHNARGDGRLAHVPANHWARTEIDGIHRLGYFSQINTDNFRADEPVTRNEFFAVLSHIKGERIANENHDTNGIITRGEAVAVLHRLEGRSDEWNGDTRFHDVPESHAHHRYIMHAVNGK